MSLSASRSVCLSLYVLQIDTNYKTPEDLLRVKSVYMMAIACFSVVILMQISFVVFQISKKKRVMGSLVMYINLVAFVTYLAHVQGWMAPVRDHTGRDIQIERYIEWMSDTPMMLFVISAAGNTMKPAVVRSWRKTAFVMMCDEIMLLLGLFHSISGESTLGWIAFWLSFCMMLVTFWGIRSIVEDSISEAGTSYEVFSMRGLEYCTYGLWAIFPVVHYAYHKAYIDWLQYETAMTFIDVVTKSSYAVMLLTGNFCIMDVVQTLRMVQMKAENDMRSAALLRADVMNEALQTAALEAEASARLSRRFFANGTQRTTFTSTKVQILTLESLQSPTNSARRSIR